MRRRDILRAGIASLLGVAVIGEAKAESKNIEEERTLQYLENIPVWNERYIWKFLGDKELDPQNREFLFTAGYDREDMLELYKEEGYALIYSPRWMIQKGHFFDILWVKIGEKNWTAIHELKGMKEKLSDCINMGEGVRRSV